MENKGVSRPWWQRGQVSTPPAGDLSSRGRYLQRLDYAASPPPRAHSAFPLCSSHPDLPASSSSAAGCGLGFLKSQDSYPQLLPSRIPMHLQGPGHSSPLPFGKALPRPFCSSFCHQAGTSGTHVTACPLIMENLLLRTGSGYAAAAGMGVKGGIMAPTALTEIWLGNRCSSTLI